MAFAVTIAARLLLFPTLTGRRPNDAAGFASRYGPLSCSPQRGFRRWASTRPVSRPSRQPATGPPDSYPDGTHTRRRQRAYVGSASQQAPPTLGAHRLGRGTPVTHARAGFRFAGVSGRGRVRVSDARVSSRLSHKPPTDPVRRSVMGRPMLRTAEDVRQVGGEPRQSDESLHVSHQLGSTAFRTPLCNSLRPERSSRSPRCGAFFTIGAGARWTCCPPGSCNDQAPSPSAAARTRLPCQRCHR